MVFGMDEQLVESYRRCAVAGFLQREAMQHLELIARFEYDQFARARNTKQAAIRPNRGTEIIAANSFLIANLAGRRIQTGHNPRVAPEPDQAILKNAGGDVGRGFFDLVSKFG